MKEGFIVATGNDIPQIRAEIARLGLAKYKLASRVNVHPCRLATMLSGKSLMSKSITDRIQKVLEEERAIRKDTQPNRSMKN